MIKIVKRSDIGSILLKRKDSYGDIDKTVRRIVDDVRRYGDRALLKYRRLYDRIGTQGMIIDKGRINRAVKGIDIRTKQAFELAISRVTAFHELEKKHITSWNIRESGDIYYGEIFTPVERVGLYVPGGGAAYPSSVIMNAVPAVIAGVREIYLATPMPNDYVLAAAGMLGMNKVYSMGGAHAIAALAYGTCSVEKVDKIAGPGNRYVTLAKRLVYGDVGIDMVAGPSEVVVVADGSVNPSYVAADLMAQAEHDEHAMSVLISLDRAYVGRVDKSMQVLLGYMSRKDTIKKSLKKNGFAVIARDMEHAMDMANIIAPEHLELAVESPRAYLYHVRHAGAVFLGPYTPEVLGDYVAGPDHVLPTTGSARFSSGLGVYDFMKRTTVLEVGQNGFAKLAPHAEQFGKVEGLDAHVQAASIRMKND